MNKPMLFVTAVAMCDGDGHFLLAQRPPGKDMAGLWEFPGGKLAYYETPEEALTRELREELNIIVDIDDLKPLTFVSYSYEHFHLFMPLYLCRTWTGELKPMEGQQIAWVKPHDFADYPMPPADAPLAAFLSRGEFK